ncbi:MAG: SMI1/KNR4 family protein [Planctomycetaceae bacterium]|jgi:hypothetical protein|nr:SMI1/KNR4 family protein [Planctomycetaceae bacterium]
MNSFNKIKKFLEKNPDMLVIQEGPLSIEEIQHIEKELGIKIAGEYLQFLQTWRSLNIYGCFNEYNAVYEFNNKDVFGVISQTLECRASGLDHKYIPIAIDDEHVCLCIDPSVEGNQKIVVWGNFEQEFFDEEHAGSLFDEIWNDIIENAIPAAEEDEDVGIVLDLSDLDLSK